MNKYELYTQIDRHLLKDKKPSLFLEEVYHDPVFKQAPYDMLHILKNTIQPKKFHPEGSVWRHTMLVIDEAAQVKSKSENPAVLMWASLLHDIGKPSTTKTVNGKITSYNHDHVGAALAKKFLSEFTQDEKFIDEVAKLIKYHMHVLFIVNDLPFADIHEMKRSTDVAEVALLGLCDRLGRTNCDRKKEIRAVKTFLEKCIQI